MEINQIYELTNSIANQVMGKEAITATDTASLVALGQQVLSSKEFTETFTNQLILRIGRTIITYRAYTNSMAPIMMDDMEWGAIVQKIDGEMPDFIEDEAWDLTDGDSVDMYIVRKPKIYQSFFAKVTPYSCYITVWKKWLRGAFLSEQAMGSFLNSMFGRVRNKLELTIENLAMLTVNNFIALTGGKQQIHLLSEFKAVKPDSTVASPMQALYDNDFLRFAIGRIEYYSKVMKKMSVLYNAKGRERHTPKDKQILIMNAIFDVNLATQVQYAAYHDLKVSLQANMEVPYWQSPEDPFKIMLNAKTGGEESSPVTAVTVENVLGILFDRDALGTFRHETEVETTPLNARGLFTNTFWHEDQTWFNDTAENGIVFLLD